jgi:glutamine synthetase
MLRRRLLAAAVVPLLLVACGGENEEKEKEEAEKAAGTACDGLLKPAASDAALPSDVPAGINGATFYEVQTQGSTKRYFAYAPGSDVVKVRDDIKSAFETAGLEIEGTDAEPPAEAEFEWKKGDTEGSVQVVPLCTGNVRIRYRVGPK